MELEKLKASWNSLNENIIKNESLNKRIIKEIINSKITTSYEKLIRKSVFDIIILIILLGVVLGVILPLFYTHNFTYYYVELILTISFITFIIILNVINMFLLMKLNLSANILDVKHQIIKYEKRIKIIYKTSLITSIIFILISALLRILSFEDLTTQLTIILVYLLTIPIGIIGIKLELKYEKRSIENIKNGIEELEDIEGS